MVHSPNFLTCPSVPSLPPPEEAESSVLNNPFEENENKVNDPPVKNNEPFIALRPQDKQTQQTSQHSEPRLDTNYSIPKKPSKKRLPSYVILIVFILIIGIWEGIFVRISCSCFLRLEMKTTEVVIS